MSEAGQMFGTMEWGEPHSAAELLPLVYTELRRLAARKLAEEKPGQTLQATELVHEAWLRLGGAAENEGVPKWNGHHHFFAAAAEAMRRILVERARHKARVRHGGGCQRVAVDEAEIASPLPDDDLLALHEALDELATLDPPAADLIKLRFFTGVSHRQAADLLGLSRSTADRTWLFARAWLFQQIRPEQS
jgi:RNA polymerase sigma factor (TIGR02999 family)